MTLSRKVARMRKLAAVAMTGTVFQFGGCDFGSIDLSNVVAVDGRQAIEELLEAALIGSISSYIDTGVDGFLDFFQRDDDSAK